VGPRTRLIVAAVAAGTAGVVTAVVVVTHAVRPTSFCVADVFDQCPTPIAARTTGPGAIPTATPPPPAVTQTPRPRVWHRLVWHDEFDGKSVDPSRWNIRNGTYSSNEASCQLASQVSQGDGVLSIRVDEGSYTCGSRVSEYASGYVDSIRKSPAVGLSSRFEWRAKLPIVPRASQGYWPALWLRSNQPGSVNPAGEIDAVEVWGAFRPDIVDSDHASVHSVHESTEGGGGQSMSVHRWGAAYPGDGFHVYAVDLLPDRIVFSVDKKLVHTVSAVTDPWVATLLQEGVTWNIRMNVQICNPRTWCSAPDHRTRFGQSMQVDYVRLYQ
jgi:beta-glucanase (GH16 family)